MFKQRQLLRDVKTRTLFVVDYILENNCARVREVSTGASYLTHISHEWETIGSNYQPKDINKALREVRT